jgi:glycosyltransferase involved in cell wall biosynthesis
MTARILGRNGAATGLDANGSPNGHAGNGTLTKVAERPTLPVSDRLGLGTSLPLRDNRPVLAVFCYEAPDSLIGRQTAQTINALTRRQIAIHLFCRDDFDSVAPGAHVHAVGDCGEGTLLGQVQEFAHRACNQFLKQFPSGSSPITLMGYEWSAVPALSLLRGIKNLSSFLCLHSLERQRSDMTGDLSLRIEEIEWTGLREARNIIVQEAATAEIAKYWVPECGDRILTARPRFPAHLFAKELDPGQIKARYQVGPVDPTVLFVGDLSERYGPDILLKSLPAALKNNKQVRLALVGDGTLYWPLRVYTRYLLLEHAVRFVGDLQGEPLHELIQAADVLVVPSRESTPWWPIQAAWAARTPVVATHHAAPGLVEHEKDSILFYPAESSCVWGIERVLFDPTMRSQIVEGGSENLEERFGWSCVAEQIEELMGAQTRS